MIILISGSSCGGKSRDLSRLEGFLGHAVDSHPPGTYEEAASALGVGVRTSRGSFTGYASGTCSWCARRWSVPCWTRRKSRPWCTGLVRPWCRPKGACGHRLPDTEFKLDASHGAWPATDHRYPARLRKRATSASFPFFGLCLSESQRCKV